MMPNDPLFGLVHDVQQRIYGFDPTLNLVRETQAADAFARKTEEAIALVRKIEEVNAAAHIAAEINPCAHQFAAIDAVSRVAETLNPLSRHLEEMDAVARAREQAVPEDSMQWLSNLRFPIDRIETHLPEIHFPESRSLAELQRMSDVEIGALLGQDVSPNTMQMALRLLAMRHLEQATRPHWSVVGTFWSSVIIGAIGVVIGVIGIAIGAITVFLMLR